jgi:hypothetical protein
MEEEFLLVHYGKMHKDPSLMTAEERSWWIKRLDKEMKRTSGKDDTTKPMSGPPTKK